MTSLITTTTTTAATKTITILTFLPERIEKTTKSILDQLFIENNDSNETVFPFRTQVCGILLVNLEPTRKFRTIVVAFHLNTSEIQVQKYVF